MIYIKLAWRNLFRNTRRTVIAGIAIGIGLASLIFMDAIILGTKQHMIDTVTSSFIGHGQIQARGFDREQEVEKTIAHADRVLQKLDKDARVSHAAPRTMSSGILKSSTTTSYIVLWGIDPARERPLSHLDDNIRQGAYLAPDDSMGILLGSRLADILELEVGDRVVATVSQAHTGEISQQLFRVRGIYSFGSSEFDRRMACIHIATAQRMLGVNAPHEIALRLHEPRIARDSTHALWSGYSDRDTIARGWPAIMPQLQAVLDMSTFGLVIMGVILFGVVSFGIVNTLFMSLYERMFEFGVLRAVGTRAYALWRLIVYEAASLALISCVIGLVLGVLVLVVTSYTGINYEGIELSGVTIRHAIYPVFKPYQLWLYPLFVLVFTSIVGMYPAWYAARLQPADTLRRLL